MTTVPEPSPSGMTGFLALVALALAMVLAAVLFLDGAAVVVALAVALTVGAVVAWRQPMILVVAQIAMTVSNVPTLLVDQHGLPSVGAPLILALLLLLVTRAVAGKEDLRFFLILLLPAGAIFALAALPAVWAPDRDAAMVAIADLARNLIITLVLVGYLTTVQRLRIAARTVALTIGALATLGVIQYSTGNFDNDFFGLSNAAVMHIAGELHLQRLSGPLPDPNYFGQLLVIALPLAVGSLLFERGLPWRVLGLGFVMAIPAALLFTFSRGSLLAMVATVVVFLVLSRRFLVLFVLAGLGLLGAVAVGSQIGLERIVAAFETAGLMLTGGEPVGDPAVIQRLSVMAAAVRMFLDNPLAGVGIGQFTGYYEGYALDYLYDLEAPPQPHSLYLQIAAERGLLGLSVLGVVLGGLTLMLRDASRRWQAAGRPANVRLVRAIGISLFGYLLTAIFLHDAYPRYFWLIVALCLAAYRAAPEMLRNTLPSLSRWSEVMPRDVAIFARTLEILRRSALVLTATAVISGGVAVLAALQAPREHTAEATLLYLFGREYFPVTPGETRRNWGENVQVSLDNALATEMHLLRGHGLFVQTAEATGFGAEPTPNMTPQSLDARARRLGDRLSVRRVQGATMVQVSFRDSDPTRAQAVLEAHIEAYRRHRLQYFQPEADSFFQSYRSLIEAETDRLTVEIAALVSDRALFQRPGSDLAEAARLDAAIVAADARITRLRSQLETLERERDEWALSQAFRLAVTPSVEVVDRRPPPAEPGLTRVIAVQAAAAGALGFLLPWLIAAVAAAIWVRWTPHRESHHRAD